MQMHALHGACVRVWWWRGGGGRSGGGGGSRGRKEGGCTDAVREGSLPRKYVILTSLLPFYDEVTIVLYL